MKVGFYAGSFDPFTKGHLQVVKTASALFDAVVVGICVNPNKTRKHDRKQMANAVNKLFKNQKLNNVKCITYDGLTVDSAKEYGADFLIRGLRNSSDYIFEEGLANINGEISGLDTIFIRAGNYGAVSSSMVNELLRNGRDVSVYVPNEILPILKK